jgi:cell division protein FtsW (lipid II flippase)
MIENIISQLSAWNTTKSERQKLQHSILVLTVVIILVAGIISLFKAQLGHDIVRFAVFSAAVYGANAIVWNMLHSALLAKLPARTKRR